jgi:DNA-binding transcriptional LysR family regulator
MEDVFCAGSQAVTGPRCPSFRATTTVVLLMDLALLRSFLAVYRTGSFTKAAPLLGITQPAVTGQIRSLENQLNSRLFLRTSRGALPTEAADELARDAAVHVDALEAALQRRLDPAHLADRTLHLGGPADVTAVRVLPALRNLIDDGLRVRVTIGLADDLLDGLATGLLDLIVSTTQPRREGIVATPLMDEEFVLVGAARWADAVPSELIEKRGPEAFGDVPVIAYADGLPLIRRYWRTVFDVHPQHTAQVVVPDLRAVVSLVGAGIGVSVLPTYLCQDQLDAGEIVTLHRPRLPPLNTLFLAARSSRTTNAGVAAVQAELLSAASRWS